MAIIKTLLAKDDLNTYYKYICGSCEILLDKYCYPCVDGGKEFRFCPICGVPAERPYIKPETGYYTEKDNV